MSEKYARRVPEPEWSTRPILHPGALSSWSTRSILHQDAPTRLNGIRSIFKFCTG